MGGSGAEGGDELSGGAGVGFCSWEKRGGD